MEPHCKLADLASNAQTSESKVTNQLLAKVALQASSQQQQTHSSTSITSLSAHANFSNPSPSKPVSILRSNKKPGILRASLPIVRPEKSMQTPEKERVAAPNLVTFLPSSHNAANGSFNKNYNMALDELKTEALRHIAPNLVCFKDTGGHHSAMTGLGKLVSLSKGQRELCVGSGSPLISLQDGKPVQTLSQLVRNKDGRIHFSTKPTCPPSTKTPTTPGQNLQSDSPKQGMTTTCLYNCRCGQSFDSLFQLKNHKCSLAAAAVAKIQTQTSHPETQISDSQTQTFYPNHCDRCGKGYQSLNRLQNHICSVKNAIPTTLIANRQVMVDQKPELPPVQVYDERTHGAVQVKTIIIPGKATPDTNNEAHLYKIEHPNVLVTPASSTVKGTGSNLVLRSIRAPKSVENSTRIITKPPVATTSTKHCGNMIQNPLTNVVTGQVVGPYVITGKVGRPNVVTGKVIGSNVVTGKVVVPNAVTGLVDQVLSQLMESNKNAMCKGQQSLLTLDTSGKSEKPGGPLHVSCNNDSADLRQKTFPTKSMPSILKKQSNNKPASLTPAEESKIHAPLHEVELSSKPMELQPPKPTKRSRKVMEKPKEELEDFSLAPDKGRRGDRGDIQGNYKCGICEMIFEYQHQLIDHVKTSHNSNKAFKCSYCGVMVSTMSYLMLHEQYHRGETSFTCDICGKRFIQWHGLRNHKKTHDTHKEFQCDLCGRGFHVKSEYRYHMMSHEGIRPWKCDKCPKSFTKKYSYKKHLETHSNSKPWVCGECGRGFRLKNQLELHEWTHKATRPHKCKQCDRTFITKSCLKLHEWNHRPDRPFHCPVCNFGFKKRADVTQHMSIHTGERNHECVICKARFRQKHMLTSHMRTHTTIGRPFKCSQCPGAYRSAEVQRQHELRVHNPVKPYTCDTCTKAYFTAYELRVHQRIHTGVRPYTCQHCPKTFTQTRNLRIHLDTHNTDLPYSCSVCGRRFKHKRSLNNHRSLHVDPNDVNVLRNLTKKFSYKNGNGVKIDPDSAPLDKQCNSTEDTVTLLDRHSNIKVDPDLDIVGSKAGEARVSPLFPSDGVSEGETQLNVKMEDGELDFGWGAGNGNEGDLNGDVGNTPGNHDGNYRHDLLCHQRKKNTANRPRTYNKDPTKPHICKYCGKSYGAASSLRLHVRVHTWTGAHRCYLCPNVKSFKHLKDYEFHMKLHNEERIVCTTCDIEFARIDALKRHLQKGRCEKRANRLARQTSPVAKVKTPTNRDQPTTRRRSERVKSVKKIYTDDLDIGSEDSDDLLPNHYHKPIDKNSSKTTKTYNKPIGRKCAKKKSVTYEDSGSDTEVYAESGTEKEETHDDNEMFVPAAKGKEVLSNIPLTRNYTNVSAEPIVIKPEINKDVPLNINHLTPLNSDRPVSSDLGVFVRGNLDIPVECDLDISVTTTIFTNCRVCVSGFTYQGELEQHLEVMHAESLWPILSLGIPLNEALALI